MLLYLLPGITISYFILEYYRFISAKYQCTNCTDEISIHFIHGSYPKKGCTDQRTRVGGLLGGHIEIEMDGLVYGFEFEDQHHIHIFPAKSRASFNSKFTLKKKADWHTETKHDKITSIKIPVTALRKKALQDKLLMHYKKAPYDYAFFGMRCASATYEDIAGLGILPEKSRFQYIIHAFYPRPLRKKMLRWARNNDINVEFKAGIGCRVWE